MTSANVNTDKKITFLSSDIPKDKASSQRTPLDIVIENEGDDSGKFFYRFINKVLDVDNLLVLAGSGVSLTFNSISSDGISYPPVAPSMWDLWHKCQVHDTAVFNQVLELVKYDKLQKSREQDDSAKLDIELLLSICDSTLALGGLSSEDEALVASFLKSAKTVILQATDFTEIIPLDKWKAHNKFIRTVARRSAKQQRLKLFTTNYDLAFENAASNTGLIVIDGFEYSSPSYFNPMWFNYDIVNRQQSNDKGGMYLSNVLKLYKIHGSVDWRRVNGRVRKVAPSSEIGEPVFIYPSSAKYQSSYDSPYLDMMTAFLNAVQQPRTAVLCLGFGFNDKHINNALTMALRTNPEFMLMVATRSPFKEGGSFNPEVRKLLVDAINEGDGRIAIADATFDVFSDLLPERRSKTPEDDLFRAFETIAANIKVGA
ncbi:SIR2 family protein [Shewanella baltica]|uniref:SIR2 family protein n=1 Tax=Shewanella baltica TaxID=62322 RepID=UPI00217D88E7|nr:SIR2 family protein [Shewanella baltica]MCS6232554.1 SIR2 family protein [Shewanella baltica]